MSPAGGNKRKLEIRGVSARQLKSMLHDGGEIALLDVREEGVFAKRHLLLAASAPLSRLELRVPLLVPRRATRVVICDGDEGLAQSRRANTRAPWLSRHHGADGGIDAWAAQGYEVYSGVNVPSKAFGEFIEHHGKHAAHGRRGNKVGARRRRIGGDTRQPSACRIHEDEHSRRHRLPGRRTGLPRARSGRLTRHAGRRQLRRAARAASSARSR